MVKNAGKGAKLKLTVRASVRAADDRTSDIKIAKSLCRLSDGFDNWSFDFFCSGIETPKTGISIIRLTAWLSKLFSYKNNRLSIVF